MCAMRWRSWEFPHSLMHCQARRHPALSVHVLVSARGSDTHRYPVATPAREGRTEGTDHQQDQWHEESSKCIDQVPERGGATRSE